jgi:hypothetical protein
VISHSKEIVVKIRVISFLIIVILVSIGSVFALRMLHHRKPYAPPRPSGVPDHATYIQGPDGKGDWEWCHFDNQNIHCSIQTVSGLVLRDETFITYRGPAPTRPEDLKITQNSGDSSIALANGAYLIPETNNEGSKRYLDFMVGDAKNFDKQSTAPKKEP